MKINITQYEELDLGQSVCLFERAGRLIRYPYTVQLQHRDVSEKNVTASFKDAEQAESYFQFLTWKAKQQTVSAPLDAPKITES